MSDLFELCLAPLHKYATKFVQQLKSLSKIKGWKERRKPKRQFYDFNKLASSFAAMEVSNQLKKVFEFYDANGDGKISPLELREVLLSLGHEKSMAAEEAEGMVKEMDRDGDGLVDIDEFMRAVNTTDNAARGVGEEDDLMGAFLIFDLDKNGLISAKELQRVLVGLGYETCRLSECREMIKGVDKDGDGFVDFQEFRSMMRGCVG
ncbi:unnamed protein product [Camellia sinensis]